MADMEEYFPRGGKKPQPTHFKQSANFLGAADKSEKKKKKPKKKSEGDDGYLSDDIGAEYEQSIKNCAVGINSQTVKGGTLVLGRVKQVYETKLHVSLPCKLQGIVMACHISEPYNKLLEAYVNDKVESVTELSTMFRPGQYVATKVLEVDKTLMLSLMPQHINSGRVHTDLYKGTLLQAAVSSVEDHGYVMDLGIPNTRAFLPKNNVNPDITLETGVLTWCIVKSTTPSSESCIVTLSNQLPALQEAVTRRSGKVNSVTPGTAFEFYVDKALDNGIEGRILSDITSYVQRAHTDSVKGKKPTLGQKMRARLLYELPTRKTPFLTMKNIFENTYPDLEKEQKYKQGDVIENAQVIKITKRALVFKLGKRGVGVMNLKRVAVDDDVPEETVIAKSYPLGSEHMVRVLNYNLSDYNYTVSDEKQVLSEKYFDLTDLSVGEIVDATVKEVADSHVILTVGRLTGMVPHAHLTDSGVCVDKKKRASKLAKKYKVGQRLQARVLVLSPETSTFLLTLKPSLLREDLELLKSYHEAEIGKGYVGVIKYIKDSYVIVSFFANVVAFVPRQYVTKEETQNIADAFHVGQIVTCTIVKVYADDKKMTGSLTTPPFWPEKKRETGKKEKRKQESAEDTVPTKKRKTSESCDAKTNINNKDKKPKDKLKKTKEDLEEKNKKDKKKSKKKLEIEKAKVSEESDAIETDIHEDSDQILTPQDMFLLDITDCDTHKKIKKRTVSLIKAIKARTKRIDTIDKKIQRIEQHGLDSSNKKYHTAMHSEKLIVQERIKILLDALNKAQEKLKQMPDEKPDFKKKKDKDSQNEQSKKETQKVKDVLVVDAKEPVLEVPSVADFWSMDVQAPIVDKEESSSSEDESVEQPKKKRKKLPAAEKVAKAREEEERLRRLEREAIDGAVQPRSVEQFERALLGNPECSQLWIAYCAFHLQSTELDKARAVCRRALNAISFRNEGDKLNVWLALINLEHRFGTTESQQKTLEEALQMNDTFKVHSQLLDILVDTSKVPELSSLVDLMVRKYKKDPQTYILTGTACFKLGMVDKARQVMQKAISVLEKKEHVSVLVQFALLERAHGDGERAEALFEQILGVYPQRVDVCSAYVDMLYKAGDHEHIRQVMERMTSQKLPARKMKVLYKKWIDVEEKIGDEDQVERIRHKAMEFIENAKF